MNTFKAYGVLAPTKIIGAVFEKSKRKIGEDNIGLDNIEARSKVMKGFLTALATREGTKIQLKGWK